jgi:ribonuclease P protein component
MLRSRRDFARIQAGGRSRADRLMTVRYVPNELGYDRFGISTGRRLGGAVQRNRVRRRIRELLRQSAEPTRDGGGGCDILIVARPASAQATFAELRAALGRLLGWVRSGSLTPTP